jgi:hypothetical protein
VEEMFNWIKSSKLEARLTKMEFNNKNIFYLAFNINIASIAKIVQNFLDEVIISKYLSLDVIGQSFLNFP